MALYFTSQISSTQRRNIQRYFIGLQNFNTKSRKEREYKKCCQILEIPETCDQEQIRRAYLHLAKKYHPDNPNGNLQKFQEVDQAFRTLIQKKARERWDVEDQYSMSEEQDTPDIKHTAPQHRQYLSNEGVGSGTPFQREKQYRQMRVMNAADNVLKHRIAKVTAEENSLVEKKVPQKHKIKTKYGFDRLVEDLIQESMSKGEFSNLSGSGKPLKTHSDVNPYVDFVTHKINQVLIDNGFTPEWITLQKEIREEIDKFRQELATERANFGPLPLNEYDLVEWEYTIQKFTKDIIAINKKIDKFNLVVPILNKQMTQIELKREADTTLKHARPADSKRIKRQENASSKAENQQEHKNLFSLLEAYFKM